MEQDTLAAVLSEFACTLVADAPIQGILDHFVERIVDVLPITSAGVTLISDGEKPHYISASDANALRYEELQTELGQGPCLLAYQSGEAVLIPDLRTDQRFPLFAPRALSAGLAAVFTFPLRHGDGRLGALDIYRETPGELPSGALESAQTLADVVAAYLLNAEGREKVRVSSEGFYHDSLHDPLTGLPNRLLLQERLMHAAKRAERSHASAAIIFVNINRLRKVNDTYGHKVGDDLLLAVARRLSRLVRSGDTLARFGGDEFVFLCEDFEGAPDIAVLAARIAEAFLAPFQLGPVEISVTAGVGMAFAGPGEEVSSQLLIDADMALHRAKGQGARSQAVIDVRDAVTKRGGSLETELRAALADDQLDVAYQPIVRSADGVVTGVEALLRWTDPTRGPVPPRAIVAAAEQAGLISAMGAWVLERACHDRGHWLGEHPGASLNLAVNVSARQLIDTNFCADVASVLTATGTDPAAVVLEMTESILLEDSDRITKALADLNDLGVRLALDDFGTGYASLSYLRRMPIQIVKIDKGFVADIGLTATGGAVVAALTNLAHVLGLTVVVEGVETQYQRDEVRVIGCDYAQGYFYARPMRAGAIDAMLDTLPVRAPRLRSSVPPNGV